MSAPRGIRNNNPGNIIKTGITWQGEKNSLSDDKFEVFEKPEDGIRALCKLLLTYQTKHGLHTIASIIERWAPFIENDTAAYINAVAEELHVNAQDPINLRQPSTLALLARAIIRHENGVQPYAASMIYSQALNALGRIPGVAKVETLTDVPEADVDMVIAHYEAVNATVTATKQPDGTFTVTATFEDEEA